MLALTKATFAQNELQIPARVCDKSFLSSMVVNSVLDVLTPLSDCRQESVEKMERRIWGDSSMYWMDFYNGLFVLWVFMCSTNFSVSLFRLPRQGLPRPTCLFFPATTPRTTTPHLYPTGYHAQGYHTFTPPARLSRLCVYIPAITP